MQCCKKGALNATCGYKILAQLAIEPQKVFAAIEDTINAHDSDAGYSKCRSYPAKNSNHTHLLIEVSMLTKPHRNHDFTIALRDAIETAVKVHLHQRCYFSL
tara:strand:- start:227 stop:532 length:306 start_codon:yes stop_codon:yes gene_type:complete